MGVFHYIYILFFDSYKNRGIKDTNSKIFSMDKSWYIKRETNFLFSIFSYIYIPKNPCEK
jgi:hypothetical protein